MSKKDGWDKQPNGYEWRKEGPAFRGEVDRVTGGYNPYYWSVLPLPRPKNARWQSLGRGSTPTLALAKEAADRVIGAHSNSDQSPKGEDA